MNLTLSQNYYTPRQATVLLPAALSIESAPDRPMRGVQIGYRPKTNSYDGLTPELFRQYIRDLAMFGANQIELIPHSFDDAPYSPHFALSHHDMNVAMATEIAALGLNVSLWFPACDPSRYHQAAGCITGNYSDPVVMAAARADWRAVFEAMPRVDTLFINAGDPGGQSPDALVALAQVARQELVAVHPAADVWVCPQDWAITDYERWVALASSPSTAKWLAGIIYGPGMPVSLPSFADAYAPIVYPVRLYPDVTHSLGDQLPVPDWDPAFYTTENRETVNPRPVTEGIIAYSQKRFATAGFSAYDEGCHDDVNKHVWLQVFWGCDAGAGAAGCEDNVTQLVRQGLEDYGRYHFGELLRAEVVSGIYALEANWIGEAATNPQINSTLAVFRSIQQKMMPRDRLNWRLQQLMYRANYDALVQTRSAIERSAELNALAALKSKNTTPVQAMTAALEALDDGDSLSSLRSSEFWIEMRVWAEAVFQSVHQQFSVPLCMHPPPSPSPIPFVHARTHATKIRTRLPLFASCLIKIPKFRFDSIFPSRQMVPSTHAAVRTLTLRGYHCQMLHTCGGRSTRRGRCLRRSKRPPSRLLRIGKTPAMAVSTTTSARSANGRSIGLCPDVAILAIKLSGPRLKTGARHLPRSITNSRRQITVQAWLIVKLDHQP